MIFDQTGESLWKLEISELLTENLRVFFSANKTSTKSIRLNISEVTTAWHLCHVSSRYRLQTFKTLDQFRNSSDDCCEMSI